MLPYSWPEMEEKIYTTRLKTVLYIYDILQLNGSFYISLTSLYNIDLVFQLYSILSYMFDECIISYSRILCKHFNPILLKKDLY
jgi:hypothetical protein